MLELLGELAALAAVVALSPLSVIPAIALVMHSDQPRSTGLAFVAGWLSGKAALTVIFIQVPGILDALDLTPPDWVSAWAQLVVGALLIAAGVWRFATRRRSDHMDSPKWLNRIKAVTPAWAATFGVALTLVNPKVILMCAAAGYDIGAARLSILGAGAAVAYFTAVAGSTAAVPILAYAVASHRVEPQLEQVKTWLQRHGGTLLTVILVAIGVALVASGIRAL